MRGRSPGFRTAFALAALVGLALGWFAYPRLAHVRTTQPIRFSHKVHLRQGATCAGCHFTARGTFLGLPGLDRCGACHARAGGGASPDEKEIDKFVWDYLSPKKNVPWLVSLRLPSHVRFPHDPHLPQGCASCHAQMADRDSLDVTLSRVSAEPVTALSMERCRSCHKEAGAADSCEACHR